MDHLRWYTSACRMTDMKTAAEVAQSLKKIPRTVARCDIYGTTRVIVDRRHARNLQELRKRMAEHLEAL